MSYLLPAFKTVTLTFALAAIATGAQALLKPHAFSQSFGLPISTLSKNTINITNSPKTSAAQDTAISYVSLMGIRQLTTGVILLIFAYLEKWEEAAIVLSVIGVLVAGTDGLFLARSGEKAKGVFHALPGVLIAGLAGCVVWVGGLRGGWEVRS